MTSTSTEPDSGQSAVGHRPDLRRGEWTRLGGGAVLGDAVTETALADLTDRSRQAARAQGYAAGWAEGRRRALDDAADERLRRAAASDAAALEARVAQESLVAALAAATARSGDDLVRGYADLADQAMQLALGIAEAVLQREVSLADDPAADAVRRALSEVPVSAAATVRLHPADLASLDREVVAGRPLTFVADAHVARGDALVETETSLVDATVSAALARIREVLVR